jgi:hydroxypyruvate reductase
MAQLFIILPMPEPAAADRECLRGIARQLFLHAIAEASVERAFERHIGCERGVLRVCEDLFDLDSYSRIFVVSIGKAAHSMARALCDRVGESLEGIVAASVPVSSEIRGFRYFVGGHPLPNRESLRAGDAILKSLTGQTPASLVLFLLSGGGSSIVEKPVDDQIPLADLIETYRVLVQSGAPIAEMNAIRKHLSSVKGGRLARAACPAQQVSILISDVPDHTLDALASGPTMPDATSVKDCYAIAGRYGMLSELPASVRELFDRQALEETPKSDDPIFQRSRWWPILSNAAAVKIAADEARRLGFTVEVDTSCDEWDYQRTADYLLERVRDMRKQSACVCLISGGEVTVRVQNGGIGGRNQQLALAMARQMEGENTVALSAGTDGIDGNSPAAGAIVDGTSVARARAEGLDPDSALARFDAYPFFQKLNDTIITGPTGNNLRDLRILLTC